MLTKFVLVLFKVVGDCKQVRVERSLFIILPYKFLLTVKIQFKNLKEYKIAPPKLFGYQFPKAQFKIMCRIK